MPQNITKALRVVVADDHILVRDAVISALQLKDHFHCETAECYDSLKDTLARSGPFDITMVDLNMPGMEGMQSIEEIIQNKSAGAVVLFSGFTTKDFVLRAIANGARGFVPKTLKLSALANALNFIVAGEVFVPMSFLSPQGDESTAPKLKQRDRSQLSDKEMEILKLAAMGLPNKEIAWRADCTEVRIKMHMRAVCKKLGVENRTAASMRARELGIV